MKKICPTCGQIVGLNHVCPRARESRRVWDQEAHQSHEARRFRSSKSWQHKRAHIRERDMGLDQAALHGLDPDHPQPYIQREGLQVHHIIPIREDRDAALDDYNLITLSSHTHECAEEGRISRDALLEIARRNTDKG